MKYEQHYALKVPEAAAILKLSEQKVRELVRRNKLPAIHDERTIRVFNPFTQIELPSIMDVKKIAEVYRVSCQKARHLLRNNKLFGYKNGKMYKLRPIVNERPFRIDTTGGIEHAESTN